MIIDTKANQACLLLHRVFRSGDKWQNDNNYSHAFWFGNVLFLTKSSFSRIVKPAFEMKGAMLLINLFYNI